MFTFGPNPTRAKKAWSSSTCLLYDAKTQHNCLCFTYKTQERVAFTLLAIYEIIWGENDAVFLINTFCGEGERGRERGGGGERERERGLL
jgi:hypothetical protein